MSELYLPAQLGKNYKCPRVTGRVCPFRFHFHIPSRPQLAAATCHLYLPHRWWCGFCSQNSLITQLWFRIIAKRLMRFPRHGQKPTERHPTDPAPNDPSKIIGNVLGLAQINDESQTLPGNRPELWIFNKHSNLTRLRLSHKWILTIVVVMLSYVNAF